MAMTDPASRAGEGRAATRFASFVHGLSADRIPQGTRRTALYRLLDATGVALASSTFEFGQRAAAGLAALGQGTSPVIGMTLRLSPRDAVLVNGILVHGLDFDDTSIHGRVHPSAFCLPAALVMAHDRRASGKTLLAAYVGALECGIRIGAASKGGFQRNGFDASGMVGVFAATLAAGRVMGLTPEVLVHAQGIALSAAAGSREFVADMRWTKRFHPGWAGVGGVTAAALAAGGFVGPEMPYEGRFGLYRLYIGGEEGGCDLSLLADGLGEKWLTDDIAVKPVPACYFNIAPVDAAAAIAREHDLDADDIESVTVLVPQAAVDTTCEPRDLKRRPGDGYAGDFSVYYAVAAALVRRGFGLREHGAESVGDPGILALAQRVDYRVDADSTFPKYYDGAVIVTLRDGRRLEHREPVNRGSSDRPLSESEIEAKFLDNAVRALPRERCERIRDAVLELEATPDAGVLAELLTRPGG